MTKRMNYGGWIGFQPANDAQEGFVEIDNVEVIDEAGNTLADVVAVELSNGSYISADFKTVIRVDDKDYQKTAQAYRKAEQSNPYFKAKMKAVEDADKAEKTFEEKIKGMNNGNGKK